MKNNKFSIWSIYLIINLLFLSTIIAQPNNRLLDDIAMPSPNVAAFNKYTDIPVSNFTGTPSIGVPIVNVTCGPLSVPIGLSYHGSGNKLGDMATWVGLGWNLNYGGQVSRSVVDFADDDELGKGYINGPYRNLANTPDIELQRLTSPFDTEPDIFSFSFGAYSGKMIYSYRENANVGGWYMYPKNDLKVVENFNGNRIESFEFTTPEGHIYLFGMDEIEQSGHKQKGYEVAIFETSTWYLKTITSADQNYTINFSYEEEWYQYPSLSSDSHILTQIDGVSPPGSGAPNNCNCVSTKKTEVKSLWTDVKGRRISKITTSNQTIEINFVGGEIRNDLQKFIDNSKKPRELDKIEISHPNPNNDPTIDSKCKAFSFEYYYSNPTAERYDEKRLILDYVQEYDCENNIVLPKTDFEYYGDLDNLPGRLSRQKDHWGYYNGKINNEYKSTLIPFNANVIDLTTGDVVYYSDLIGGGIDRESSEQHMLLGSMKKITYPTGGSSVFTFGANEAFGLRRNGMLEHIIGNEFSNCANINNNVQAPYLFTSDVYETAKYKLKFDLTNTDCYPGANGHFTVKVSAIPSNSSVPISTITVDKMAPMSGIFDYGLQDISDFHLDLVQDESYEFQIEILSGEGIVYFDVFYLPKENNEVGGLRIENIMLESIESPTISTDFNYYDVNNMSTGVLLIEPKYGYMFYEDTFGYTIGSGSPFGNIDDGTLVRSFHSSSVVNLSDINNYYFGYKDVAVTKGDIKANYHYDVVTQSPSVFPKTTPRPNYSTGKLLKEDKNLGLTSTVLSTTENIGENATLASADPIVSYKFYPIGECCELTYYLAKPYFTYKPSYYRLNETITIVDGVQISNTYGYDPELKYTYPEWTQTTNSDSKTYRTEYTYIHDYDINTLVKDDLLNRNIIAMPWKTEQKVDGVLVNGNYNTFEFFNGYPYLEKIYKYETNSYNLEATVLSYNTSLGKPTSVLNDAWVFPTNLVWNLNGTLLSKSYSDFVTSYEFYPNSELLKSITNPDGTYSSYEYDDLMRLNLSKIYSSNGGILKASSESKYFYKSN